MNFENCKVRAFLCLLNASYLADSQRRGAGSRDVRGWKKTAEQESKQGTDTPSLWKVIEAYSLTLPLCELHKTQPVVHEETKSNYTERNHCRNTTSPLQKWSPQKCQTALIAVVDRGRKYHWHTIAVKCPTRRTTRERKANALTVAEMSRKMEPVRPQQEARPRRLRPETSARVVREETDTDVDKFGDAAFLPGEARSCLCDCDIHALRHCKCFCPPCTYRLPAENTVPNFVYNSGHFSIAPSS